MTVPLPSSLRPLALAALHRWQYYHDLIRGKWRTFSFREMWLNSRERRKALRHAVTIVPDVNGFRFVVYPFDRRNLTSIVRHPYDISEFRAIPLLVREGDVALDIGANVGLYSVLLSRLCGRTGRVWAFEPIPETHWRLRETLVLNRCENVIPVRKAACDKSGTVQMNLFAPQFSEWNTLGLPSMPASGGKRLSPSASLEVPACCLDRFCEAESLERINFLKVDVEGFEVSVFLGAQRLLREHRVDYICFEISQEPLRGAGVKSRQVFEALEAYGYSAYRFDRTSGRFEGPVRDTSEEWTNFFASWKDLSLFGTTRRDKASPTSPGGLP